ncbi:HEPN domain-containing protein [Paremcibacter congregatus]|uniref:Uncharacterized protein n=1 Tax=Paremcibacter congregatus TaxID=2043170 RepID=A0A2G4YQV3_9PROT|nr:HEPN domain-containing protein [Paremcibacter congregatus]PHZ84660.1 hypothetical protein CRD36_10235 [Paremcibacter congregatus]QDE28856.1 hypothetical protein FIV45_17005 [Paremcibacter congregatus]
MRVETEYKKSGLFWLPENENKKIPGTLIISDGGKIELEVIGLWDESAKSFNDDYEITRIIGDIEQGGLVTLNDCFFANKSYGTGCISRIIVNGALVGAAWEKDEKVTFNTLSFSVDCLDEWVGIRSLSTDTDQNRRTTTISCKLPENIGFTLDNGMELDIFFRRVLLETSNPPEAKITQLTYFKLKSKELRGLSEFTDVAFKLTNLMCFVMDETVTMKNISATTLEKLSDWGGNKKYPTPISIYYESKPYSEKVPSQAQHKMLFNFDSIKDNAQLIFNKWINAYKDLSPALNLYFSTQNGGQKFLEGRFLALAQGLENYHRRTNDETLMDSEEYNSLRKKILDGCPRDQMKWLEGRLMHGNEINFGKRLKRIIEPFKKFLGINKERESFIWDIVSTRNYLTHYSKSLKDQAVEGIELWELCEKMDVIFQFHFLKVIGFTDEEINSVVENCYPLQRKLEKFNKS